MGHVMTPQMERVIQTTRDGIKICSFSATLKSILLWSHYANNHQGFCTEYEVASFDDVVKRFLFPVIYDSSMFDCTKFYAKSVSDPKTFNNIFALLQALYKAPEWSYEEEWRLVFTAGVIREETNYPVGRPKRVHLGARMSEAHRAAVLEVCRRRKIEASAMELLPNSFQIVSKPIA